MHANSGVQLWNRFLTINSDSTHQKWMKFAFIVTGSSFLQSYWVSDNAFPWLFQLWLSEFIPVYCLRLHSITCMQKTWINGSFLSSLLIIFFFPNHFSLLIVSSDGPLLIIGLTRNNIVINLFIYFIPIVTTKLRTMPHFVVAHSSVGWPRLWQSTTISLHNEGL